jgi:Helix-turn-helix domain
MIEKELLCPQRVRKITTSFAFIEHRFLQKGYWGRLSHHELLLYLFLVLVADRWGMSYYSYDRIVNLLKLSVDEYIAARDRLIEADLIAFNGQLFQVLSLPEQLPAASSPGALTHKEDMLRFDPPCVRIVVTCGFHERRVEPPPFKVLLRGAVSPGATLHSSCGGR